MFAELRRQLFPAFRMMIALTLITGMLYPLLITSLGKLLFPRQAQGSFITRQHHVVGSQLIGQPFTTAKYFWGRPSATVPFPYNAMASSASNLGPTNPVLFELIKQRIKVLRKASPHDTQLIPVDLVTNSASGLDPDISPYAALYQVPRVARARGISEALITRLVKKYTKPRQFGILGEERVNVLELNLALDEVTHGGEAPRS